MAVVDNTSSDEVAALYPSFLSGGLSVVTPNKKAYSSSLELYRQIIAASESTGAKFLNESTVGAGLPIIQTLKDLVQTGDKVCALSTSNAAMKLNLCPVVYYDRSSKSKAYSLEHYRTFSTSFLLSTVQNVRSHQ